MSPITVQCRINVRKIFMITTIETTGTVNTPHQLQLDAELPENTPERVRVIVLFDESHADISDDEWRKSVTSNEVFDFLKDEPDIYTLADGKPITDEE